MARNLKVLGLALCMAMALGALTAQGAAAAEELFHSSSASGKTHLTAVAKDDQLFEATTGETKAVICKKVSIDKTAGTATFEGTTTPTITVRPIYEECGIYEGSKTTETTKVIGATVNTTGCHYKFFAQTTEGNPTGGKHANVEIVNVSNCEHIKITVLGVNCIEVPAQLVKHAVNYKEVLVNGKKSVEVEATAHGIKSTTTNNNLVCPTETGGTVVHEPGLYTGKVLVTGFSDAEHKNQVDIWKE